MDKSKIVADLISQLRTNYERAICAVQTATEGATGDDTKAESKYDTRGLEASYLAVGQVAQADQSARDLAAVENFEFPDFQTHDAIGMGALVVAKNLNNHQIAHYLMAPAGGGSMIETEEKTVTVIGSRSPLTGHLLDQRVGDKIEHPPLEILSLS